MFAPVGFLAYQEIFVNYNEENFHIWVLGKMSKDEFSEFNGERRTIWCELTEDMRRVELEKEVLGTNCHWVGPD